jgi:hypothetical protein
MEREEYIRKFPDHCTTCEGWGILRGYSPIFTISECECFKERTCPRCGTPHALDESVRCEVCGWNVDDEDRGLPGSHVE